MKYLSGSDLAGFIQERHAGIVRGLSSRPKLAIVRIGDDEATSRYIKAKKRYAEELGIEVEVWQESAETILRRVDTLNGDESVTGIIVQLPLPNEELTATVLNAIAPFKDVDGLGDDSSFDAATPKAVLWLLAGHNIDLSGKLAIVGQGRLVGKPLADMLEDSGRRALRYDEHTKNLQGKLIDADVIVAASGRAGIITAGMIKPGAVVVDAGAPDSEVDPGVRELKDVKLTPNPGGVGPMTVTALFDNLLIAAQLSQKS